MTQEISEKESKEVVLRCSQEPHPDFLSALQGLRALVLWMLDLPEEWAAASMTITQVSFSNSANDVRGVVITGVVHLDSTDSPFCFNTPHMPFADMSAEGQNKHLPDFGETLLEQVEKEARAYMNGKRLQPSLLEVA